MQALESKLLDVGVNRIADMDEAGIDLQVLSPAATDLDTLPAATATALARDTNDFLASVVRTNPTRFAGFATVALLEPETSASELERCIRTLGFKGVMLNGTVDGKFLDDPSFTPFFEAARSVGHSSLPASSATAAGNRGCQLQRTAWGGKVSCSQPQDGDGT